MPDAVLDPKQLRHQIAAILARGLHRLARRDSSQNRLAFPAETSFTGPTGSQPETLEGLWDEIADCGNETSRRVVEHLGGSNHKHP